MPHFFLDLARLNGPAELSHALQQTKPSLLSRLTGGAQVAGPSPSKGGPAADARSYQVTDSGVAVIGIRGGLASEQITNWYCYGEQSYEGVVRDIEAAVADPDVKAIMLQITSPGGTVLGCAAAAARIDALAEQKPIWAHCGMACSGAYWLAAAANRVIVDVTGEVGSIGVITAHMDASKFFENWGLKITPLISGDRKADGHPYAPLDDDARENIQRELDVMRDSFVNAVAGFRGIDAAPVKDTQARCYHGAKAVEAELADDVLFFHDALAMLAQVTGDMPASLTARKEDKVMARKNYKTKASSKVKAEDDEKREDQVEGEEEEELEEDEDQEQAADDEGDEEEAEGDEEEDMAEDEEEEVEDDDDEEEVEDDDKKKKAASKKSERDRCKKILGAPEANGRQGLAQHLAFNTDMSAKDAIAAMAAAPADGGGENPLIEAMSKVGNPSIGGGQSKGASGSGNPILDACAAKGAGRLAQKQK